MKIIRINATDPTLNVGFHPDSTLVLQGRPLFMPEDGDGWQAEICVAVKISRLGKNIGRKFAPRYYDGVTCAMRLVLPSAPEMAPVIAGMDSSIAHGEWIDPSAVAAPFAVSVGELTLKLEPQTPLIDDAISSVSRYTTLKMGDMILLPVGGLTIPAEAPGRIVIGFDDRTLLDQKLV